MPYGNHLFYPFILFFLTFWGFKGISKGSDDKGLQYVTRADAVNVGYNTEKAEIKMEIFNASGDSYTRKLSIYTLEVKVDGDKSLMIFHWPADVRGTKMLTWTHKKGQDDQWLYLPSLKKTKRIASRSRTGSFMGSEFSFEDLGSLEVEKYSYKFIGSNGVKGETLIERYPVDSKSGYKKQLVTYDDKNLQPKRIEYYDRKGEKLKTAVFGKYQKFSGFWRPDSIHMKNHQTHKESILTWNAKTREIGVLIEEETFLRNSLED